MILVSPSTTSYSHIQGHIAYSGAYCTETTSRLLSIYSTLYYYYSCSL